MSSTGTITDPNPQTPVGNALLGLGLMCGFLGLFSIGSQVPSSAYADRNSLHDIVMWFVTLRETNVAMLGILASCLGTWRRRNQDPNHRTDYWYLAYISAGISGLVMAGLAIAMPSAIGLTSLFDLSRASGPGQQNYTNMALLGSFVAFLSGYDDTIFDRVIHNAAQKLGLQDKPAATVVSPATIPSPVLPENVPGSPSLPS